MLAALTLAAGLNVPEKAAAAFADVPADTPLARQLAAWIDRRWIVARPSQAFRPQAAMSFSEFKQHAYHVLFDTLAPQAVSSGRLPAVVGARYV